MTWLVLTSLCIAVGGIVLMSRGGVPESVSGLVYNLSERMRWAWSGWLIAVATTLMVPLMSALGDVVWLIWIPLISGTMGALNDAEEMPRVLGGYGVIVAEVMCAVSLYGCLLCVT